MLQQSPGLLLWMGWMGLVNLASLAFLGRPEARWVLGLFLASFLTMNLLFALAGYGRLLGLAHVLFWTPLLVLLLRGRALREAPGAYGIWLRILFMTNAVSLVIDYTDVARYLLGDPS